MVKQSGWKLKKVSFVLNVLEVFKLVGDKLFGQSQDIFFEFFRIKIQLKSLCSNLVNLVYGEIVRIQLDNLKGRRKVFGLAFRNIDFCAVKQVLLDSQFV